MAQLTINDLDLKGKTALVRVDYNVPMEEKDGQMVINDLTRITETLSTLKLLQGKGARTVLIAHLGRPKGSRDPALSLKPVAQALSTLLQKPVAFSEQTVGETVRQKIKDLAPGSFLLLENLRFHREEEENCPVFSGELADLADVYINDAFGAAHRAHASTEGVARAIRKKGGQAAAGLLMGRELKFLGDELEDPARPFVVILGGAKVSDKIKVIDRLIDKADTILIGGAMAYTFKLAQGHKVGKSLVEPDRVEVAKAALAKAAQKGIQFLIPSDNVVATPFDTGKKNKKGKPVIDWKDHRINAEKNIPDSEEGVDIGPATSRQYAQIIRGAKTILWNGPMGIFEDPRFADGTMLVAQAVTEATEHGAKSIIGGGDSVKALNKARLGDKVTFMSTGGGASLEFLEGQVLPGVAALSEK